MGESALLPSSAMLPVSPPPIELIVSDIRKSLYVNVLEDRQFRRISQ